MESSERGKPFIIGVVRCCGVYFRTRVFTRGILNSRRNSITSKSCTYTQWLNLSSSRVTQNWESPGSPPVNLNNNNVRGQNPFFAIFIHSCETCKIHIYLWNFPFSRTWPLTSNWRGRQPAKPWSGSSVSLWPSTICVTHPTGVTPTARWNRASPIWTGISRRTVSLIRYLRRRRGSMYPIGCHPRRSTGYIVPDASWITTKMWNYEIFFVLV